MELHELNKELNNIPIEQRTSILKIIEHKIDTDMKEVINEIKNQNTKFDNLKNEIKVIYWVIGLAMTIIIAIISLKK
jgi:hypothetical protein